MASSRTLINGTGYDIKKGRTLVGGTGYDIKKGRTLIGGTGYDISFSTPLRELPTGQSIYMNVDSVRTEYIITHQGDPYTQYKNNIPELQINSNYNNAPPNGTWVLMKKLYMLRALDSLNNVLCSKSDLDTYLNTDFIMLFDAGIRALIKPVYIPFFEATINSEFATKQIFIPCFSELNLENGHSDDAYAMALDYFKNAGANERIAYYNDETQQYWMRNSRPSSSSSNILHGIISKTGTRAEGSLATMTLGIRPEFILDPDNTFVDSDFNIIVPQLKTVTLTNIMANDGKGWFNASRTNCTWQVSSQTPGDGAASSVLVTPSATGECCLTSATHAMAASHKYYLSFKVEFESQTSATFDWYWPVAEPSAVAGLSASGNANTWIRLSAVFTRTSFADGDYNCRWDYNNEGGNIPVRFTSCMLFDLTAAFGAGREPSKAWMDSHVTSFGDSITISYYE